MRKIVFVFLASLLMACRPPVESPPRTAVILSGDSRLERLAGLQDGLTDLGYIDGNNIELEIHNAHNDMDLLAQMVDDIVAEQPDLIVALGGIEADLSKKAADDSMIPIVFVGASDVVERGLVDSMMQSDNNLTGVDSFRLGMLSQQVQTLARLTPTTHKILLYYLPDVSISALGAPLVEESGREIGLEVQTIPLQTIDDLKPLVEELQPGDADAILLGPGSPILDRVESLIAPAALQAGIPILSPYRDLMTQGILAAYGPSAYLIGRQGARMVDKTLRGTAPGNIPIEIPDRIELIINLDTAQRLGIVVPDEMLALATEVIPASGDE